MKRRKRLFNGEDITGSLERRWVARVNVLKTNGIHETFTHQVYFVSKIMVHQFTRSYTSHNDNRFHIVENLIHVYMFH